jgi:predicted  nucleic acid-binding Zn-ribbon protein
MTKLQQMRATYTQNNSSKKHKIDNLNSFCEFLKNERNEISKYNDNPEAVESYLESMEAWIRDYFGDEMKDIKQLSLQDFACLIIASSMYE